MSSRWAGHEFLENRRVAEEADVPPYNQSVMTPASFERPGTRDGPNIAHFSSTTAIQEPDQAVARRPIR